MAGLNYSRLARAVTGLGYPFWDRGDYNLNLIGLRTDDKRTGLFNDWLFVAFRQNDYEQMLAFQITTDPGIYWLENPMNVEGTAIVVPGHYEKLWRIGLHKGQYPALVQDTPINVYRDNDRDTHLDTEAPIDTGMFGINLHRASRLDTDRVGKWSAGCQVFRDADDFDLFMAIAKRAAAEFGDRFSYTLMTERQFWEGTA